MEKLGIHVFGSILMGMRYGVLMKIRGEMRGERALFHEVAFSTVLEGKSTKKYRF